MTKLLLTFGSDNAKEPIVSKVIVETGVQMNILAATVDERGGSMIIDFPNQDLNKVRDAFESEGVLFEQVESVDLNLEVCIACGVCATVCPVDAIEMTPDYLITLYKDKCIRCMACIDSCPVAAIRP
ncbi:MAG: 4Fe-4S binding protein [Candidatus Ranarchaeia archaeon]|jgi:ferredoxin